MATGPTSTLRVYLVDDHEVVRRGLRDLLESEGDITVVGESGSAQVAARQVPAARPDVAIVDGRLPDGSGVEVCRAVRSVDPGIAVLVLTSYDDDDALFSALMAGASGYLLKQVDGDQLVQSVRRVAAGQSLLDPQVTAQVLDRLRHGPAVDPVVKGLTPQEHRILELIGQGLTNRQIAAEMFLAEKTVKNYASTLYAKLGLRSRTQAALLAVQHTLGGREPEDGHQVVGDQLGITRRPVTERGRISSTSSRLSSPQVSGSACRGRCSRCASPSTSTLVPERVKGSSWSTSKTIGTPAAVASRERAEVRRRTRPSWWS